MRCPECNEEMTEIQTPSISAKEVMKEGQFFPEKIVCHVIHIFGCSRCPVRATKTETKDYRICDCVPNNEGEAK